MVLTQNPRKPKVAIVVGSGGIKTLGVLSLFRLLNEHHIQPDVIYGTSGGTILSSLWASGFTTDEMEKFIQDYIKLLSKHPISKHVDYRTLLSLAGYPGGRFKSDSAVLKKEWLLNFFNEKVGSRRVEDSKIKTKILCTELQTGFPFLIDHGLMGEAIYASCALYPILPPIFTHDRWLVDGVYNSSLPIFHAVKDGYDHILVLSFEEKKATHFNSYFQFYLNFISEMFLNKAKKQNSLAINMHHGEVKFVNFYFDKPINFWEVNEIDYINKVSDDLVQKNKNEIIDFINQHNI